MQYAILCYDREDVVESWTPEQDAAVIAKLDVVVLDGPFAETKEQLLGFFIVECASLEQAIATAKELGQASSTTGAYEIRPLRLLRPGVPRR